jgi:phosphoserine aminotransferase
MVELAGHRSVGGVRASIHYAVPVEAVRALQSFMERFRTATP